MRPPERRGPFGPHDDRELLEKLGRFWSITVTGRLKNDVMEIPYHTLPVDPLSYPSNPTPVRNFYLYKQMMKFDW